MKIMNNYPRLRVFGSSFYLTTLTILFMVVFQIQATSQCALACNDKVFVSLDDGCTATLAPNIILEGDENECANEQLIVEITDETGYSFGNTLTSVNVGQTLKVSVISDSGNSCWSELFVEDKNPPVLVCDTVYTTCTGSLIPGSPISGSVSYAADITVPDIPDDGLYDETFDIDVFGLAGAMVTDINFYIVLEHTNLSDLSIRLENLNGGGQVTLFDGLSATCNAGMMVTIDDDATNTYAELQGDCSNGIVLKGSFQGSASLDALIGNDPIGIWEVRVEDNNSGGGGGTISKLVLVLEQSGGIITFPGDMITILEEGENQFELLGLDACGPALATYTDEVIEQDCDSPFDKKIIRTWYAQDEQGNVALPCDQMIYVYRNDLSTLVFPPNFDGQPGNPDPLSCTEFGDMIPGPDTTGYPTGDICDNVQILPPKDQIIDICDGSYKILREWKVLEWCSGDLVTHTQIIKVIDDKGPDITPLDDITISTEIFDCFAIYQAPKPEVTDDCSDEFTYQLSYQYADIFGDVHIDGVFTTENVIEINGNFSIDFLPLGKTLVKWRITDECDQVSEEIFEIFVEDQVPPVAVCDEFTVVSIGSEGWAEVAAFTFDDISHDNCEIVNYEARKMTDDCNIDNKIFRDTIKFCCAEVNTSIMVEFRVTDSSDNSNTCMVEVKVQDKLPPFIYCPEDITLDCFEDYKDLEITGDVVPGIDAIDNCGDPMVEFVDDEYLDQCGEGYVIRTWTATDAQGLKYSCEQRITLYDMDPFDRDDIDWAKDYITESCDSSMAVEDLEYPYVPRIDDDNCSLTAITYEDQNFYIVQDACEKIIRTWTVIDWCTYDPRERGQGIFTDIQILKRVNKIAPIFTNCEDREIPAYNENCTSGMEITIDAFDDCTPDSEIVYSYEVDHGNNGTFNDAGEGHTITKEWPLGEHRIKWQAEDKCGNISVCDQIITVVDKKKPTPYCITNLTTVVMNNNGMIEVWARDYNWGSFDNCTSQYDLLFTFNNERPVDTLIYSIHYFKGDGQLSDEEEYLEGLSQKWFPENNTSGMVFHCGDLPDGISATINVDMTVWDKAGNYDFCSVILQLQDNEGDACQDGDPERVAISGHVATEDYDYLDEVQVSLESSISELSAVTTTSESGEYAFGDLLTKESYQIDADRGGEFLNGVSTMDIVMIQRHLLGIEALNSPYKIIAADIDNNNRVSSSDVIGLRKSILGIITEFPRGQKSWRFLDRSFKFADDSNPFPYENGIYYNSLENNLTRQDMIAVKVGDVTNDAKVNARQKLNSRTGTTILSAPMITSERGTNIEVPIYGEMSTLLGMQFTIDYDPGYIQYYSIIPGQLATTEDNVGMTFEKDGILTFSWNEVEAQSISSDQPLFILEFKVLEDLSSGIDLNINSSLTEAEAYLGDGSITGIEMIQIEEEEIGFALMQNAPNPFTTSTRIDFRIPETTTVYLEITDISGKVIKTINQVYPEGFNSVIIDNSELSASGILYYTIRAGKYIASKKMVSIK